LAQGFGPVQNKAPSDTPTTFGLLETSTPRCWGEHQAFGLGTGLSGPAPLRRGRWARTKAASGLSRFSFGKIGARREPAKWLPSGGRRRSSRRTGPLLRQAGRDCERGPTLRGGRVGGITAARPSGRASGQRWSCWNKAHGSIGQPAVATLLARNGLFGGKALRSRKRHRPPSKRVYTGG